MYPLWYLKVPIGVRVPPFENHCTTQYKKWPGSFGKFHSYCMKMSTYRRLYALRKRHWLATLCRCICRHNSMLILTLLFQWDTALLLHQALWIASNKLHKELVLSITLQVKLLLFFFFRRRPQNGPTNVLVMPRHWDRTQVPATGHKVMIIIIYQKSYKQPHDLH